MKVQSPLIIKDFSRGRVTKYSASSFVTPQNSVSDSMNVNFDIRIGSAVVRLGTTLLGSTIASNKTPLGLTNFISSGGSTNLMISVFSGASNASVYYYDSSWHTSGLTTLNNSNNCRFDQLGNRVFIVNGSDAMKSSTDGNTWATTNCITTDSVIPSLIFATKSHLLASGYSGFRDRVYFSSVIDPNASPTLTWNTNPATGDFIDINPDDGSNVTGFAEVSSQVLVFKTLGIYRLDVINKTVDTKSIYDYGAISQEGITTCQGNTYFFSGVDISRTNGGYPEQISRLGVQDYIDAIPQANWSAVCAGHDNFNVFFSIGNITLNTNKDSQITYNNVVLKFSTRDESWSVHYYGQAHKFYSNFTTSTNGRKMIEIDTTGSAQTVDLGNTDNSTAINYFLETQNVDFGNRAHAYSMNNLISVMTKYGTESGLQIRENDGDYKDVKLTLEKRVNIGNINARGNFFNFKWWGLTSTTQPQLEGIYVEDINDEGMIQT